jgi:inositol phosphorylceramide synthase catalytic subunit
MRWPAMNRPLLTSLRQDWLQGWREMPPARRYAPVAGVLAFWAAHAALGGFRGDHVALGLAVIAVAYAGPLAAAWFRLLLPLALMGAVYDGQGYVRRALHGHLTIHVTEPAAMDRLFFGISTAAGTLTPPEWLQLHTHPVLDLVCGTTYLGFIPAFAGVALWFRWLALREGNAAGARLAHEAESMTWAFFWLGLVSCTTYYLYPAAPPWYAELYGWGPAVLDAAPSAAGAARMDALLGVSVFSDFYARTPNVFGAIPSLHAAIPLLAFGFACRVRRLRIATGLYALLMAFAAMYLNHHYAIDVLWGWAYTVIVGLLVIRFRRPVIV